MGTSLRPLALAAVLLMPAAQARAANAMPMPKPADFAPAAGPTIRLYTADLARSSVRYVVRSRLKDVKGSVGAFQAAALIDPRDLSTAYFDVSLAMKSVTVDGLLPDFLARKALDVRHHPEGRVRVTALRLGDSPNRLQADIQAEIMGEVYTESLLLAVERHGERIRLTAVCPLQISEEAGGEIIFDIVLRPATPEDAIQLAGGRR